MGVLAKGAGTGAEAGSAGSKEKGIGVEAGSAGSQEKGIGIEGGLTGSKEKGIGVEAGSYSTGWAGWLAENEIVTLTSSTSHSPAGTV